MGETTEYRNRIINEFDKLGYETVYKVLSGLIMKHHKIEKDVFSWFVRNDIMEKVDLKLYDFRE